MSKRRNKSRPDKPRPEKKPSRTDSESRRAHLLTILWTLSVTTAFLCDIGAAVTRLLKGPGPLGVRAGTLSGLLLFAASVTGLLVLILLPVVLNVRRRAPPRGYIVFAVLVAAAPLLAIALQIASGK